MQGDEPAPGGNGLPDGFFRRVRSLLGDKELNAAANSFVDQIKSNGVLKKAYETWMKQEPPTSFPDTVEGVPFVAS